MNKVRVIARLDINNDSVVKGKCLEGLRKIGSPEDMSLFYYKEGIDEIIFLDAVASLYDRNSLIDILKNATRSIFVPITIGGGIKTIDDIKNALNSGADKVAINTQAVKSIEFVKDAVETFGSQAIVGSVVARRHRNSWEAFIDNAKHRTHRDAIEWAKTLEKAGVGELIITSIDNDGRGVGYDIDLVNKVAQAVSIPVIASGGAGSEQDIVDICNHSLCDAVAVSSIFHYKTSSVKSVKTTLLNNNIQVRL